MKKRNTLLLVLLLLAGCTRLSAEDSARIDAANRAAEEAKAKSALAAEEAYQAREDADRAAALADEAARKSDRIFQQGQKK